MSLLIWFLFALFATTSIEARKRHCKRNLNIINYDLRDAYCDQPMFMTFLQRTEENLLLDNVCLTYFPLPDDQTTYQVYTSRVYCDGSSEIISYVATIMETGVCKYGSPYCTFEDHVFGYAGCDTYLVYRCIEFGDCGAEDGTLVFGLSKNCKTIGLSCLRKIEEIVESSGIANRDYYVLPMRLPNRCVTQQICVNPPNPFHYNVVEHKTKLLL